ncbi:hypothetical protein ACN42_g8859 [Penicillium freii]|uniref:LysM domain-containing protein n=1 Tax=Penicillium freii TaxID=48697 RepID=A0A117NLV0_PENFR|nr:hypothetical protein ACN42_g8859 [Penicillium freii]
MAWLAGVRTGLRVSLSSVSSTHASRTFVQQNDTCLGVASSYNLTLTQLLSWNSAIDPVCANWENEKGHIIRVSNLVGYVEADIGSTTTVDAAAPVPTDIGTGSNKNCAQWFNVTEADSKIDDCLYYS